MVGVRFYYLCGYLIIIVFDIFDKLCISDLNIKMVYVFMCYIYINIFIGNKGIKYFY